MNIVIGTLVLAVIGGLIAGDARSETFECAFLQEQSPSGKSNKATCSMLPEKVFSTRFHTPEKNAHCEVKPVVAIEDLTDVLVDTGMRTVAWTLESRLTEESKRSLQARYIKEGMSKEEAEKQVNRERADRELFQIASHIKSMSRITLDEITGKILDPPKEAPEHHLVVRNKIYLYYLYIPEASGHAILLEPITEADSSWINMRFGKCRKTS